MDHEVNIHVRGTEEAAHGIGKLALFFIPLALVLALGAVIALVAHVLILPSDVHTAKAAASTADTAADAANAQNRHALNQVNREEAAQQRADNRVGAAQLPTSPIKLTTSSQMSCLVFDSAYLDNGLFTGYVRNTCTHRFDYYQVCLSGYAPDGTIVEGYCYNTSSMPPIGSHEKVEVSGMEIGGFGKPLDDRVVAVKAALRDIDD